MPQVAAEVGSTVNNYELLGKLAAGGMAEIFLARSASAAGVSRYVVLKRILQHRATDPELVKMFLDEARLAAQLQHANIAQVYDVGKLGESYFFTMEYVHGETVRSILHRANGAKMPVPLPCVLAILAGAAAGLHYAHERRGMDGAHLGIVHRDVSPSNLMVSYDGGVKVVDFGVAKATGRMVETQSGTVKGKISYLSPEQCRGAALDRRTDLFSLGIVLWEMLTTRRLYRRESDFENMSAIVNEPPPPPSQVRPDVPPELDALALRLLAKRREDRFATCADLLEGIEEVAIKMGSLLSSAAVARYLKDMFGVRPEPWIETQMTEAAEGVTVTSEPLIPGGTAVTHPLDLDIDAVPDWSRPSSDSAAAAALDAWDGHSSRPTTEPPTTPARPTPMPAVEPPPPAPPPPAVPAAESGAFVPATMSSSLEPGAFAAAPVSPTRRKSPFVWIGGAAAAIALVAIVWAAKGSGNADKTPTMPAETPGTEPPPPRPAVAAVTPDAAVQLESMDAGEPPVAVVAAATPDAAVQPESIDASEPPVAIEIEPAVPPRDFTAEAVAAAKDGKYVEAVAACAKVTKLTADLATTCAVAACGAKDAGHARRWAKEGRRAEIAAACRAAKIDLEAASKPAATKRNDCGADLLGCQK